jgi:hypothetical protein
VCSQPSAAYTLRLINCVLVGNEADSHGGAIHSYADTTLSYLALTNCTLISNQAAEGRALACTSTWPEDFGTQVDVVNSVLRDGAAEVWIDDLSAVIATSSNFQGGWDGEGNIDEDPMFVIGPTGTWTADATYESPEAQTIFTDDSAGWVEDELAGKFLNPDIGQSIQSRIVANTATTVTAWGDLASLGHIGGVYQVNDQHLSPGSPCVNAGDDAAPGLPATDFEGDQRLQQCRVDMGADETGYFLDCNSNGQADACDLEEGTSPDANTNGIPDECECAAMAVRSYRDHDVAGELRLEMGVAGGIEPRIGGVVKLEVDLDNPAAFDGGVTVECEPDWPQPPGTVTVTPGDPVTLEFTPALPDQSRCQIVLDCGATVCVRSCEGDTNLSGSTTTADALQIKPRFGQAADNTNARFDVNTSGGITTADFLVVKVRFGQAAPGCP